MRDLPAAEQQRLAHRLKDAAEDFLVERFGDALATLRPLAERYAAVADVQELYGLTLYRLGRWTAASHRLERYEELTGAVDQLPVLADCYRALGRLHDVHDVWDRLRSADPDAQTITEGRIVTAGALADEGRPRDAIRLLEAGPVRHRRPKEHHLRLWYALADLYDRVGDLQRARRGFARLAEVEPDFADAADRLKALGDAEVRS
ncbi:tetratricopeptide repeat protein [Candidatus Poriferisodalis sp.]|uniref:tetratricopeptide repeat protein n=1 Tax=Candidatus Poriferisodalis sp. TaxID=3101277 RepID=UPI003B0143C5